MDKTKSTIPNLYDEDGSVIKSYKLAWELTPYLRETYSGWGIVLPEANPATGWMLPVPATLVVGKDGRIAVSSMAGDYSRRMEPSEVLAAVRTAAEA